MGFNVIEVKRERRTYITGQFQGKYWSEYDAVRSDGIREDFYDINLYEADVIISAYRQSSEGPFTDAPTVSEYVSHSFPQTVRCSLTIDGINQYFDAKLRDPIVANLAVVDVRQEDEQSLGTLTGEVYGYLLDYVSEWIEVEEPEPTTEDLDPEEDSIYIESNTKTTVVNWPEQIRNTWRVFEKPLSIGNSVNVVKVTTPLSSTNTISEVIGGLFSLIVGLFWLFILINLFFSAGPILFVIAALWAIVFGLNWLLQFDILRTVGKLFLYLVLCIAVFGFLGTIGDAINTANVSNTSRFVDIREEQPGALQFVENQIPNVQNDSLIRHYRVWQDYSGKVYQGWLTLSRSSLKKAQQFKQQLPLVTENNRNYDRLFDTLSTVDANGLHYIYATFDSLRRTNNLDSSAFANLLVSCVQDIPYTILLPDDCNPRLYPDDFTQRYLTDGGACEGYVKYGLNSPLEFIGTLKGDCDTRTLLLYTILKHYQYDVIVLTNNNFGHSLLAVSLPGVGSYRQHLGKRYYVWETTTPGMIRGQRPSGIPDLNKWHIIDKYSTLQ